MDWLGAVLPCVSWLRSYPLNWLISDIIGGLSVGFLLVPQSLSYATTAGLPAVWGLYGGFVPCLLYFGFGTSRQLAVGPVAVTSVLIQSQLSQLLPCTSPFSNSASTASLPVGAVDIACQTSYNNAATQLAFIVACLYTGIGVLQMGWLTKFLGHAIISGFMSGAAITIGSGQVKYILGYKINMINGSTKWQDYWYEYTKKARNLRWQEYIMGVMFIYILVLFKYSDKIWSGFKYVKNFGPLFVSLAGIAGVYLGAVRKYMYPL